MCSILDEKKKKKIMRVKESRFCFFFAKEKRKQEKRHEYQSLPRANLLLQVIPILNQEAQVTCS